ncbi:MAG TPA: hypothetical protein VEU29_08660 [Actinomycetota bacterium]|nr:hypothetical protein [Actinomycetota bacterium]
MSNKRLLGALAVTAALIVGPAATPASAQPSLALCHYLGMGDPYDYPCEAAERTAVFAVDEAGNAVDFASAVRDDAGQIVFDVYCAVFPNQPQCL